MNIDTVRYAELCPEEFRHRIFETPVAYLPLGTIEWHGEHLPLGTDLLISEHLMNLAAKRFGGIVLPPLFLGPDRMRIVSTDHHLYGMDFDPTTIPPRKLAGSCYWVPDTFFSDLLEHIVSQAVRAGFKAIFADGHGPSRKIWSSEITRLSDKFEICLLGITEEIEDRWTSQVDHAALNETSQVLYARPDLVKLDRIHQADTDWPQGVDGEDPREASGKLGHQEFESAIQLIGTLIRNAGHL